VSLRGTPTPIRYDPGRYWEERAQRFAGERDGLAAVCSYGMPEFYNRLIHRCQHLSLERWLDVAPGTRVLDVGCGVGRWSRLLAARGALVTGIDLSPTMIAQARRRAREAGVAERCRFLVQDTAMLDAGGKFELVLAVTVLQHILEPAALHRALTRMVEHLSPAGRLVLLEAAPCTPGRCDTSVFTARRRDQYLALFAECGLRLRGMSGVDPAPFKSWLLPHLSRLPRPLALLAVALTTVLSAPVDTLLGRRAVARSWHAVFVLERESGSRPCR
jgi:SAM-dependent methyltransferase